jgi:hypothetical protein
MAIASAVASGSGSAAAEDEPVETGRKKDAMSAYLVRAMAALRFGAVVLALAKP